MSVYAQMLYLLFIFVERDNKFNGDQSGPHIRHNHDSVLHVHSLHDDLHHDAPYGVRRV